ncbi:GTP pyrophosphokinase [Clostridium ljungdahlii]|uniref:RelA/SpoT domain-containing protein n=1 Tax=Clostridium ljungdahlii TaxID=1538 RepID=A0A162L5I0_9CLOT|nr:RelA/SpoT domain-containing protein [Clostridium ljungdahlii]OAA84688.1 hypothetical protein WY13_02587 [Clostridium ljungdahlii]
MLGEVDAGKWYDKNSDKLEHGKNIIQSLLLNILDRKTYFKIEARVKTKKSLLKKIADKSKYESIFDITDIIGMRIIVPINSYVDKIAEIIKKEFKIDEKNTIDKRKKNIEEFRYKSLHIICQLDKQRENLPEYELLKNLKFEIQVRTILQHAWPDYEHDIGYKGYEKVSEDIQRRIYRLSALLEIADDEFQMLSLEKEKESKKIDDKIGNKEYNIEISDESLYKFCIENDTIKEINLKIVKEFGELIEDSYKGDIGINMITKRFIFLGLKTIEEINEYLEKYKEIIVKYIKEFSKVYPQTGRQYNTVSLFYLVYIIVLSKNDEELLDCFIKKFRLGKDFKSVLNETKKILESEN